jgi:hypothetical protein
VSHVQARDGDKEWEQVGGAGVFKLTWDTRRGSRERTLEIRAWDKAGNVAWTTIQVKVGP